MNNTHTIMNRLPTLATIIALSVGATGISHAEINPGSCQTELQEHIDWLSQPPAGSTRKIDVVVTSLHQSVVTNYATPVVGYLETGLNYGAFLGVTGQVPTPDGTLYGSGQALLNTNRWTGNCNYLNCPDQPFDPNNTETWHLTLKATENTLLITMGNAEPVTLPLDCSGNSIVATGSGYSSNSGWSTYMGRYRYELFLSRVETGGTVRWNP